MADALDEAPEFVSQTGRVSEHELREWDASGRRPHDYYKGTATLLTRLESRLVGTAVAMLDELASYNELVRVLEDAQRAADTELTALCEELAAAREELGLRRNADAALGSLALAYTVPVEHDDPDKDTAARIANARAWVERAERTWPHRVIAAALGAMRDELALLREYHEASEAYEQTLGARCEADVLAAALVGACPDYQELALLRVKRIAARAALAAWKERG